MKRNVTVRINSVLHRVLAVPVDGVPDLITNNGTTVVVIQNDLPANGSRFIGRILCLVICHRCAGLRRTGVFDPIGIGIGVVIALMIVIINDNRIRPILRHFDISLMIQGRSIHICRISNRDSLVMRHSGDCKIKAALIRGINGIGSAGRRNRNSACVNLKQIRICEGISHRYIVTVSGRLHNNGVIHFSGCGVVRGALGYGNTAFRIYINVRFNFIIKRQLSGPFVELSRKVQVEMGIGRSGQDIIRILTEFDIQLSILHPVLIPCDGTGKTGWDTKRMVLVLNQSEPGRQIYSDRISALRELVLTLFIERELQGISDIRVYMPGIVLAISHAVNRQLCVCYELVALNGLRVKNRDNKPAAVVQRDRQRLFCAEGSQRSQKPLACFEFPRAARFDFGILKDNVKDSVLHRRHSSRNIDTGHAEQLLIAEFNIFHPADERRLIVGDAERFDQFGKKH